MNTIRLNDGTKIYQIGSVTSFDLTKTLSVVAQDHSFCEMNEIELYTVKRLIKSRHKELHKWLVENKCLCTYYIDYKSNTDIKLYGIGFHPAQRKLETMFIMRWS